jgi:hypothetical protein
MKLNMLWIVDYLAVIVSQFQDPVQWIRIIFLILVLGLLIIDLWGRYIMKRKGPEDYLHGRLHNGYIHYWHCYGTEGLSEGEVHFQKRLRDAGVDWILEYCLIHSRSYLISIKPEFSQIKKVAAAWAGYIKDVRGPEGYRWIVELMNGRYLYIRGFFDPSGFEVRTALWIRAAGSAEKAAQFEIRMKTVEKMIKDQEVYNALLDQIKSGERDWVGFEWGTDYAA